MVKVSYDKVSFTHIYSMKVGLVVETVIAVFTYVLAPQIAWVFTQSESASHITNDLTLFLRIICIFYPTVSLGLLSSSSVPGRWQRHECALCVHSTCSYIRSPVCSYFCIQFGHGTYWCMVGNGNRKHSGFVVYLHMGKVSMFQSF